MSAGAAYLGQAVSGAGVQGGLGQPRSGMGVPSYWLEGLERCGSSSAHGCRQCGGKGHGQNGTDDDPAAALRHDALLPPDSSELIPARVSVGILVMRLRG